MKRLKPLLIAGCCVLFSGCATTAQDQSAQGVNENQQQTMELYTKGLEAYSAGDFTTAERHLAEVIKRIPKDAQVWFRLGNIYAQTNRPARAVDAYQNALLRDPQLSKAWHNMGVVHLRQAANDFISLANSVPPNDPLHGRGTKISNTILALLDELPEDREVEVDLRLEDPEESRDENKSSNGSDENTTE